jgi:hypothetical protein
VAPDPDNVPPRSRLFMVVPKTANGLAIEVRALILCASTEPISPGGQAHAWAFASHAAMLMICVFYFI